MTIDYGNLEEQLKEKLGMDFEEKIKFKQEEKKVGKEAGLYLLARENKIKIPQIRRVREFKPEKLSTILNGAYNKIGQLRNVGFESDSLNDEFNDSGAEWVQFVAIFTGFGKVKQYRTSSGVYMNVGFVDDTGFMPAVIMKKENIDRLKKELVPGKCHGIEGARTNYYSDFDKVSVKLQKNTNVFDAKLEVDRSKLAQMTELEDYGYGIFELAEVEVGDPREYRTCLNQDCSRYPNKMDLDKCPICGTDSGNVVWQEYTGMNGGYPYDFVVPPYVKIRELKDTELLVISARERDEEMSYTCVGVVDGVEKGVEKVKEVKEEFEKTTEIMKEDIQKEEKKATEKIDKIHQKIDEPKEENVSVTKMQYIQAKKLMMNVSSVEWNELEQYCEGFGMKKNELVHALNTLKDEGKIEKKEEPARWVWIKKE